LLRKVGNAAELLPKCRNFNQENTQAFAVAGFLGFDQSVLAKRRQNLANRGPRLAVDRPASGRCGASELTILPPALNHR